MNQPLYAIFGAIYTIILLLGFYLAFLYGRKTKIFRWSEYIAIIFWPILFVILLSYFFSYLILLLFLVSSVIGFVLEYLVGLTYYKTLNRRLWEYKKFSVDGHTSFLSVPIWGCGGVIFWLLSRAVGL